MTETYRPITPDNTAFAIVSFEGPDPYSMAGGLGVRVSELSVALAEEGFESHLIFIGSATKPATEQPCPNLTYWRACQGLARAYSAGVYQGEGEKLAAFETEVPPLLLSHIARPLQASGKLLIVMGEDWQSARTICAIHDLLYWQGIRDNALILWNANSIYGFDHIDWNRLQRCAQITAVSRYMKGWISRQHDAPALVLPNGIPARHLKRVDPTDVRALRQRLPDRLLLTKFARFAPDKNWLGAVQATARLRSMGQRPLLFMRGGVEPYGWEVLREMESLGLRRRDLRMDDPTDGAILDAIEAMHDEVDAILMRFFVPESVQRLLYAASDAVLANSQHEPFGLVGLEVMGARGVVMVGSTGESYAQHLVNAISLDTIDPNEIVGNVLFLQNNPTLAADLRRAGHLTARFYTWPRVIQNIITKLQYLLMAGGVRWPAAHTPHARTDG